MICVQLFLDFRYPCQLYARHSLQISISSQFKLIFFLAALYCCAHTWVRSASLPLLGNTCLPPHPPWLRKDALCVSLGEFVNWRVDRSFCKHENPCTVKQPISVVIATKAIRLCLLMHSTTTGLIWLETSSNTLRREFGRIAPSFHLRKQREKCAGFCGCRARGALSTPATTFASSAHHSWRNKKETMRKSSHINLLECAKKLSIVSCHRCYVSVLECAAIRLIDHGTLLASGEWMNRMGCLHSSTGWRRDGWRAWIKLLLIQENGAFRSVERLRRRA